MTVDEKNMTGMTEDAESTLSETARAEAAPAAEETASVAPATDPAPARRRGRPRKNPADAPVKPKRKVGRPRKVTVESTPVAPDVKQTAAPKKKAEKTETIGIGESLPVYLL